MIEPLFGEQVEYAAASSCLRVIRTEHHALNSRMQYGADAHRTRLEGHHELATDQAIIPEGGRGIAERNNFGVGSGIVR